MADTLHLIKVPLRADKLAEVARRRQIPLRDLDDGYLAHCILKELWQDKAPGPFVLRGSGRHVDVWGYSHADAAALAAHARSFGDPSLLGVIDDLGAIASKAMPVFESGQRIGFHLRSCPVVRLAKGAGGHRAGAEVDAFLARCFKVGKEVAVSREEVYREWLLARLGGPEESGVQVERVGVAAFARECLTRRTHAEEREAKRLERPDVRFDGDLVVADGARLAKLIERGVGRHRAFGFGALVVVAPGTPYPRA
ncbi:MAG: type I-E CRISPR-associated protein Cas6/Cse3/CasE [Myxococcales bacterium]